MDSSRYICNGNCAKCRHTRGSEFCDPHPRGRRFFYRIDRILTNRWLALPILVIILFLVFEASFTLGAWPQMWIDAGIDALAARLQANLPGNWLSSCLVDGVIRGCGAVISFLPNILILFIFLSLLEDSGYMARAAFIMDKLMHRVGLHGNSFIPMLVGFGCNVPAIMAARNIGSRKNRTLTMLMIPFMSCSARLPVYMLIVAAFFPKYKALVMISLYVLGILLSVIFAQVLKRTSKFRNVRDDEPFVLPPFRIPEWSTLRAHVWERSKDYLQKITTVIVAASVVIWALEYFPTGNGLPAAEDASYIAQIGRAMEPVTAPLGFDWKLNVCILTGLPAKEAIVSTMGILYPSHNGGTPVDSLRDSGAFTPATALSFMVFVLLYFPCLATIRALRSETNWRWAAFTVVHSLVLAWVVAFITFRVFSVLL